MVHNEAVRTIVLLVTLVAGAGAQTGSVSNAADFGVGAYSPAKYWFNVAVFGRVLRIDGAARAGTRLTRCHL